jgi:hypothetical protein
MPFQLSLKRGFKAPFIYKSNFTDADYNLSHLQQQLKELMSFLGQCGIAATVVGDPKQSQPINLSSGERGNDDYYNSFSAIDWIIKSASHDTLHITHRLPDTLAELVDDFAGYGGLASAPEACLDGLLLMRSRDQIIPSTMLSLLVLAPSGTPPDFLL